MSTSLRVFVIITSYNNVRAVPQSRAKYEYVCSSERRLFIPGHAVGVWLGVDGEHAQLVN
jgi:hypothetical protein